MVGTFVAVSEQLCHEFDLIINQWHCCSLVPMQALQG